MSKLRGKQLKKLLEQRGGRFKPKNFAGFLGVEVETLWGWMREDTEIPGKYLTNIHKHLG